MLWKTHLAITLFFVLLFIGAVEQKAVFVVVALVAALIPDVDSGYSKLGNRKTLKLFQCFSPIT